MNLRRGAVVLVALATLLIASSAWAAALRCRSDPTILLSDGTVIDVSADIGTGIWNVTSVSYTVQIPIGLVAVAVIRTPDWPTTKEFFAISSDSCPGVFGATTVVRTASNPVEVTATELVTTLLSVGSASTSGKNGQKLVTTVYSK